MIGPRISYRLRLCRLVMTGMFLPLSLSAQSDGAAHLARLSATPIGALPPLATPMQASRDQHYWGARVQAGRIAAAGGSSDATAFGAGVDLQWRGGSIFGLTAGRRSSDCAQGQQDCGDRWMYGARARLGLITGGPTIAALLGDYSASTSLGAELGAGYAPRASGAVAGDACTVDLGLPVSLAMLQTVRLVVFATPGMAWDVGCPGSGRGRESSFFAAGGVSLQQLFHRGFDVHLGLQRMMRAGAGLQLGIGATFIRLP